MLEQQGTQGVESMPGFFAVLERFEQELLPDADLGLKRDRFLLLAIGIGMVMALGSLIMPFLGVWQLVLALAGVVFQFIGIGAFMYRQIRDIYPDFVDAKWKFALDLDRHYSGRERVLAWLAAQPEAMRHEKLSYVEARLESLRSRYSLIFGAVEKLGFLPVLVGVFLQIQIVDSLSWPKMVLGIFIIALYMMSLWMARFRLQLESYARLIRAVQRVR